MTSDLIDRRLLLQKLGDLVFAAARQWGTGSIEHNLVRDVSDLVERAPKASETGLGKPRSEQDLHLAGHCDPLRCPWCGEDPRT